MTELHIDFETFSTANLVDWGAYRYGADPSTEILMAAFAIGDEEPQLFIPEFYESAMVGSTPDALKNLRQVLSCDDTVVYAHNAQFEIAVSRYCWGHTFHGVPMPRLHQWRCTAAMARRAALHASLAGAAEDLQLEHQKDKRGSDLIKKFSMLQTGTKKREAYRIFPMDDPAAFAQFAEYCVQDVRVERDIHKALRPFELKDASLDTFQLDTRINDRGVPVNVPALRNAKAIVEVTQERFGNEFRDLTMLNPTQRGKVMNWLRERGYPGADMQAMTVENALKDTTWAQDDDTVRVLTLYSLLSYAAVTKIDSMLNCECGDGYVRGTLRYYGAGTGRWSGQLIQPQNLKRPTIKGTDGAYAMICEGCTPEDLELLYGNPIEVISSCIRHFMQPKEGNFYQADYSAVEARIVCWLADQHDALEEYRKGADRYISMATKIYGVPSSQVNADQRFIGKQAVLGCGFQMWWPKFKMQCAKFGVDVSDELAEEAVIAFRELHHKVAKLWRLADDAARQAINNPGKWFKAGSKIQFARTRVKSTGMDFLLMKLPSGRMLAYPKPAIKAVSKKFEDGNTKMVEQITFYGQLPMKQAWGRISTYGGKLVENATQATAADLMANGAVEAERIGFEISTLIHDEALAYEHPTLTLNDFADALCKLPAWAKGLPLAAEGKVIPYYLK